MVCLWVFTCGCAHISVVNKKAKGINYEHEGNPSSKLEQKLVACNINFNAVVCDWHWIKIYTCEMPLYWSVR